MHKSYKSIKYKPNETLYANADTTPLDYLGQHLYAQLEQQIASKSLIEDRMLEDLRQYQGRYSSEELKAMRDKGSSEVYVNLTRPKTEAAESQLNDILNPNDDKNWSISATPKPELTEMAKSEEPYQDEQGLQYMDADTEQPVTNKDFAEYAMHTAREKARKMEAVIDDQLTESDYHAVNRQVLHHGCLYGTGIMKAPEITAKIREGYRRQNGSYEMEVKVERVPRLRCVNPWDYYPDMSAASVSDAEFEYERQYMTAGQMKKLFLTPGYNKRQIMLAMKNGVRASHRLNDRIEQRRALSGLTSTLHDNRFEIWYYYGEIPTPALNELGLYPDEDNPLDSYEGMAVLCGSHVIKVVINPFSGQDKRPYSVWNYVEDEHSIFGYGVPYLTRNPQKIVNTSWRMMLDDSGLTTGGQVVVNKKLVKPANGKWEIKPRKIWEATGANIDIRQAFGVFQFDSHQQQIGNIYNMARGFMDEESSLLPMNEGEGQAMPTLGAQSMVMNMAGAKNRLRIKRWDDNITKPCIRRIYHFNMKSHPDDSIKGDYDVDARGTSALLVKETQQQNLMILAQQFSGHPAYAEMIKQPELFKKILQSMQINPDEVTYSEEELEQIRQQAMEHGQQSPDDIDLQIKQLDVEFKQKKLALEEQRMQQDFQKAQLKHQGDMQKLAQEKELHKMDHAVDLKKLEIKETSANKRFSSEVALKRQAGSGI